MNHEEKPIQDICATADRYIKEGTGTWGERQKVLIHLGILERNMPKDQVEDEHGPSYQRVVASREALRQDTTTRFRLAVPDPRDMEFITHTSIARATQADIAPLVSMTGKARPTERGRIQSREAFEAFVTKITGCKTGDGTLSVNEDRTYTNPHVQYFWARYQTK